MNMVRDRRSNNSELLVTVPSFFKCPISMDVMKSPVSLCTGITYDRSSIQKWLDSGHNTCPATMQVLNSTDIVPNLTLRRLIHIWSDSSSVSISPPIVAKQQLVDAIKNIENKSVNVLDSIAKIVQFAKYSGENREFLVKLDGFVGTIVGALSNVDEIKVSGSIVHVLNLILDDFGVKEQIHRLIFKSNRDCLSPFVSILQKGTLNSRIESARILAAIAFDAESQRSIVDKQGLLYELYRFVSSDADLTAIEVGLSTLTSVSTSRSVKKELVRFGIVKSVTKIISGENTVTPIIEKALELLATVSTCTEGRTAIAEDENCVSAIVQRVMKVSSPATEQGIVVLWSVCYLSRHRRAQGEVMKMNGVGKVLLVMQSHCSASVRMMCGDLVKVLRVNSKSCLASYQTRTTHITPY